MIENIKHAISVTPKEELQERAGDKLKNPVFYGPSEKGCEVCDGQGYKGRLGIYEVLEITS